MKSSILVPLVVIAFGFWEPANHAIPEIEKQIEHGRSLLGTAKDDEGKAECLGALKALKAAAKESPNDAKIQFLIGITSFYLEQNDEARSAYRRAIELAPKEAHYHFMLGVLERYSDDPKEAAKQFQVAVDLAPKAADYWYELAAALDSLKQPDRALKAAIKAVELDSTHSRAFTLAGDLEAGQGRFKSALGYYQKAVALNPKDVDLNYNCAQMLQNLGRSSEALKRFQKVVELSPNDWRTQAKIVQCAEATGEKKIRDNARNALFDLKRRKEIKSDFFVRDQFKASDKYVMAMEYFELNGDEAVRYSFNVMNKAGEDPAFRISLGSYDVTNEAAHAAGEIGPDERLFHLDRYEDSAHQTFAFFHREPSYEVTKAWVVEILAGKRRPTSSMTPTSQGAVIELDNP